MTDPYSGQDLLADVFPDTEDAPLPVAQNKAVDGGPYRFVPSPSDPRWHLDAYGNPRPRRTA